MNAAGVGTAVVMSGGIAGMGYGAFAGGTGLLQLGVAAGPAVSLLPRLQDVLNSAQRLARSGAQAQATRALQALQKKVDNPLKSTAFSGLPKTDAQARAIIEQVFNSTSQVVRQGVNRAGQAYVDVFDSVSGRGVRVLKSGEFDTFVNLR